MLISGVLIAVFSSNIVFPGLELLLGPEAIVGKRNVVYIAKDEYLMTNPGAMMKWQGHVIIVGMITASLGRMLIWRNWKTEDSS